MKAFLNLVLQTRGWVMECRKCSADCVKDEKQKDGTQRFKCKSCGLKQQAQYKYNACRKEVWELFQKILLEGVGQNGLSRILKVSHTTIIKWIRRFKNLKTNAEIIFGDEYEVDEVHTYIGNKENTTWIMYAISRTTGNAVDLVIGRRTSENFKRIIDKLLLLNAKLIYTDRLPTFKSLIPKSLYKRGKRRNQKIERNNLNLRQDISRLARRIFCFSKQKDMLEAHLRFYF